MTGHTASQLASRRGFTWAVGRLRSLTVPAWRVQVLMLGAVLTSLPWVRTVDNDYWYHVRTGRLIVESGIPGRDPYSWTAIGKPWVPHEWLAEMAMYAAQSVLGFAGVVMLLMPLVLLALLIPFAAARRRGVGTRPLVALQLLAVLAFASFEPIRPQAFSWLFFSVFVAVLLDHQEGRPAMVWALPPIMLIWVNVHLGFYFGFLVLMCWFLGSAWDRLRGRQSPLVLATLVSVASLAAAFVNPSGPEILAYPLRFAIQSPAGTAVVTEFQHPSLTQPAQWPIFIIVALLLAALASPQRPRAWLSILTLVVIALGFRSVRHMQFATLLLLPVCGPALAARWDWASSARDSAVRVPALVAGALVGVAFLIAGFLTLQNTGGGVSLYEPNAKGYPAGGAEYVRQNYPDARMFNDFNSSHFLIYTLYPDQRVFIDGRFDFYGNELMSDYLKVHAAEPGWQEVLNDYGVEVVLVTRDLPVARALARETAWQLVFDGSNDVVYARTRLG